MTAPRPGPDLFAEQAAFMRWARTYFGPRAEEHLQRSGLHFLTPQTVAMFDAWLAARWSTP